LGVYLRRLRQGYGYTLRKVEERAQAIGETIDNSQLSRFEKGKAVPSFDKLRALAKIFNVSVQNFSDILDLERYEPFRPPGHDYDALLREGVSHFTRGEHGRALVTFERALEVAEESGGVERSAEARRHMAAALKGLGKLSLTEAELRAILKERLRLGRVLQLKVLLELGHVYRQLGDLYLASVVARECLDLAVMEGDLRTQAAVLNSLGSIHHDEGDYERALREFERSLEIVEQIGGLDKLQAIALTNFGGCLVSLHRFDEGLARLREAYAMARQRNYRRVAALSLNRLGEALFKRGDHEGARKPLADSDGLASRSEEAYHDILFMNAFLRWKMAREEGNPTRETIAFGRLRHLRSLIERSFPEVQEFDRYVEGARRR
jgi:tetratricopeptide (TPR) repeat protein